MAFLPQLGPSTLGSFAHARDFEIRDSQFYDFSGGFHHHHTGQTEFDRLQKSISEHAFYDSKARSPPPRCYPETRVEVLKKIADWIDDPDPHERIFWLNGPVGAGKSAITQTIAERCKDTQLAASFFFQRNTSDRGVADRLFLTLAWQLAISIPDIRPYLESTLKTEPWIHAKSIDVQFDLLFVQVFENLLRDNPDLRPQKSLVIIDAVDECATDHDQKMILALIGVKMPKRVPLHFLISSRPEPAVEETFDTSVMRSVTRALVLNDKVAPDNDIRKYLEGELSRIFEERRIPPPTSDVIHHLVSAASGQFIYPSAVVEFISDADCNPRKQLEIILGTRRSTYSPYTQLDQLYIQILSRQQRNARLLKGVFVLILAFGQISLNLTCRLLWIKKDDLKLKLRRMHSLLHVSDSGIRPYHLSFLEFLQDRKRAGRYYVHPWLVTMVCARKVFHMPYAMPITVVIIVMMLGLAVLPIVGEHRWSKTVQRVVCSTWFALAIAIVTSFIGLAIWIRRRQKEAVIRGLLAEPAA
ncbi:hypothetical protein AX14_014361 [Amanita brunnescens Koide BX004]|nr:hypothetical protein AX14_014361 [Amanita brunnescens Koide BX004]